MTDSEYPDQMASSEVISYPWASQQLTSTLVYFLSPLHVHVLTDNCFLNLIAEQEEWVHVKYFYDQIFTKECALCGG